MAEEKDKKQQLKDEITKAKQAIQELSDDDLKGVSGGVGEKGDYKTSLPYMV